IINGKVYRLSTTDSEEYIKSVAEYVNRKYTEILKETSSIARLSEYFPIMLALNIADDLFKKSDDRGKSIKANSDLENKVFKLENSLKAAEASLENKNKELEGSKLISEEIKTSLKIKEEETAALSLQLARAKEEADSLKLENKRLSAIITDAGLVPPVPDKNGKIKDKDKDRETLLKELNDIKSENGRTKKENKNLAERLRLMEEELTLLKSTAVTDIEAGGQVVITSPDIKKETAPEGKTVKVQKQTKK
ncbi:MAG: cell division protein ZapA, partial [Clostridiales bacterium]|nr:cell division protein ZapA [Clostridiales bacterium]